MAYVAGANSFAMLANSLTGVAQGTRDFAQLKMKRDAMAQDQAQHNDRIGLALRQLDEQINQANLDRTQRAELEKARNELNAKLTREGYVSSEKRARIAAGPGHARVAEQRRQYNYEQQQRVNQDGAINAWVNTLPPLPPSAVAPEPLRAGASPADITEFERLTQQSQMIDERRRRAVSGQAEQLAAQLAGPTGEITPALRAKATAIISDKEGFSRRVHARTAAHAQAKRAGMSGGPWKRQQYDPRTMAGRLQASMDTASEFPKFEPAYQNKSFYGSTDPKGEQALPSMTEAQYAAALKDPQAKNRIDQAALAGNPIVRQNIEKLDLIETTRRFQAQIGLMPYEQASEAQVLFDKWTARYDAYLTRAGGEMIEESAMKDWQNDAKMLDYMMGNTDRQFENAAITSARYDSAKGRLIVDGVEIGGTGKGWAPGTVRAEDVGDLSPGQIMRDALSPTRVTDPDVDYDYEDQLIDQWDAAVGGGRYQLAEAGRRPATMEEMMGAHHSKRSQKFYSGPYVSEQMHGDKTIVGIKEKFESIQHYQNLIEKAGLEGAPQEEIDKLHRFLEHAKEKAIKGIEENYVVTGEK